MGVMTISIDDDIEARFREVAKRVVGEKKGYLGQAVTEALRLWLDQRDQERVAGDALMIIGEGHHFGEYHYTERRDLHDRAASSR